MEWKSHGGYTTLVDSKGEARARFDEEWGKEHRLDMNIGGEQGEGMVVEIVVSEGILPGLHRWLKDMMKADEHCVQVTALVVMESRRRGAARSSLTTGVLGV